jgi:elongation factor 1-gamma
LGKNPEEYASILKWLSFVNGDVLPTAAQVFRPLIGDGFPYNKKSIDDNSRLLDLQMTIFEARLAEYTYLVGQRVTFADVYCAIMIHKPFTLIWGTEWRKKYPNVTRWFKTIVHGKIVAPVLPDFKFAEKPVEYVPPKKEKKAKKASEASAAAPAAGASTAGKSTSSSESAATTTSEQPKPKHPLELLGKPKAPLDEWKRQYSNNDTKDSIEWFWKNQFDPSEWSLWKVDYKYNDELTLCFMSNNLIGGFFARLSASTKYLFGCMVVYGENNNNGITGAFLVRGQEFEPAFDVAPDWESYQFSKLDPNNPQDKAFFDNMLSWDHPVEVDGQKREISDGKVFK